MNSEKLDQGFAPILGENPTVLILGSMPGQASLHAFQYYAHPRNAFWYIMGELFGAHFEKPYQERVRKLRENGIAVWDVIYQCARPGSLDSAIVEETVFVNDFEALFKNEPQIKKIIFNGATAEKLYRRKVLSTLDSVVGQSHQLIRLPSTSPAHASVSRDEKLKIWADALG